MGLNRGLVKRVGLGLVALSVVSGISTRTGVGPLRIVPVAADTTTATPAGTVTPAGTATVGASPAGTESFLVTEASVAATDGLPAGSEHQSFTINCAGAQASPTWMTDGTAPTCTNGQLTIDVSPATHYYDSQNDVGEYCPSAGTGCAYVPSNYDVVIQAGQTLRIGGSWVREQYSSYQFTANYIWNPGANVTNPPPDPRPSTVQDYAFEHRFVVDGAVVQAGSGLPGAQLWSQKWGIVLGQIPTTTNATTGTNGYSGNTQVAAIAAAHQDPTTGDPQLVINMVDTSPANQISYAIPLTRYWVQDSGGQYIPASKADATTCTASYPCAAGTEPEVEVAGSYGWLNGDWVFLAEFVWRPMPGLQPGYYSFNEDSTLTTSTAAGSTDTEGWYDGSSVSGPGDVNPAGVTFDITWSLASDQTTWQLSGSWEAARCIMTNGSVYPGCQDPGTISGTLSGTWDPSTEVVRANVIMENGTGKFCGKTGSGSFQGEALAQSPGVAASAAPPQTFNGGFAIEVATDPTASCP